MIIPYVITENGKIELRVIDHDAPADFRSWEVTAPCALYLARQLINAVMEIEPSDK